MVKESMAFLQQADPQVAEAIGLELKRQQRNIELIASENIVSEAVLAAAGSVLTNKYAEGYSGHRYYGGCEYIDLVENLAVERVKQLFGAKFANVQPTMRCTSRSATPATRCWAWTWTTAAT